MRGVSFRMPQETVCEQGSGALYLVQFSVQPIVEEKWIVTAPLHDLTLLDHHNFIGMLNGAEAVRNNNGCSVPDKS